MMTYKAKRVCERCGRDEAMVKRQDEPEIARIVSRNGLERRVSLCIRCWQDIEGMM